MMKAWGLLLALTFLLDSKELQWITMGVNSDPGYEKLLLALLEFTDVISTEAHVTLRMLIARNDFVLPSYIHSGWSISPETEAALLSHGKGRRLCQLGKR